MMTVAVRRYQLARVYLGWHAVTAIGFGLELVFSPRRLISGPATVTIYALASPRTWGCLFIVLAALCAAGVRWPRHAWRFGMLGLSVAQTCWALGLFVPLFTVGRTNLLASAPWIALAITSGIVARVTVREERLPNAGRG